MAYDTAGMRATCAAPSGSPINLATSCRTRSAVEKNVAGAMSVGRRLARTPAMPASSTVFGIGVMYAAFR